MKKAFFVLVLVFSLVVIIPRLHAEIKKSDVDGWGKSRWGMTADDIVKVFAGEATLISNAKDGTTPGLSGQYDAHIGATIKKILIQSDPYKVSFVFDDKTGGLIRVILEPLGDFSEVRFNALEALLSEKYGPATYKEDVKRPCHSLERRWAFSSTTIRFDFLNCGSGIIAFIAYQKNIMTDSDKL